MKKKTWITVGVVGVAGWLIPICFVLHSNYKAHIARHQAEIAKCQTEAFDQGVKALQNRMLQELESQGSLRIIIDGEERILVIKKGLWK